MSFYEETHLYAEYSFHLHLQCIDVCAASILLLCQPCFLCPLSN